MESWVDGPRQRIRFGATVLTALLVGYVAVSLGTSLPVPTALLVGASGALERRLGTLRGRTVGILGMAFKAESDDPRASLSYKLRKLLAWAGARVLATDP